MAVTGYFRHQPCSLGANAFIKVGCGMFVIDRKAAFSRVSRERGAYQKAPPAL